MSSTFSFAIISIIQLKSFFALFWSRALYCCPVLFNKKIDTAVSLIMYCQRLTAGSIILLVR